MEIIVKESQDLDKVVKLFEQHKDIPFDEYSARENVQPALTPLNKTLRSGSSITSDIEWVDLKEAIGFREKGSCQLRLLPG